MSSRAWPAWRRALRGSALPAARLQLGEHGLEEALPRARAPRRADPARASPCRRSPPRPARPPCPPCEADTSSAETSTEGIASRRALGESIIVWICRYVCVLCAPGSIWINPSNDALLSPVAAPRQCTSPPDGPVSCRSTANASRCSSASVKNNPRNAMSPPGSLTRPARGAGARDARPAATAASGSRRRARRRRSAWRRRTPRPDGGPSPGPVRGGSARRRADSTRTRPRATPDRRPRSSPARSYSCTRNSLELSPTISVRPYWATPAEPIAYTISNGSSTATPGGTYRNAPPVHSAALAASSLCRSIVRRLE